MIYINDVPSFRNPESCEEIIEDRIEKIELINGNTIQDYGHCYTGDTIALTCIFHETHYNQLMEWWGNRQKVTFTDERGNVWEDMRLVIQRVKYVEHFPEYLLLTFELWRI